MTEIINNQFVKFYMQKKGVAENEKKIKNNTYLLQLKAFTLSH